MNVLTEQPTNLNQLSNINFRMLIRRSPTINYFCYEINLPGISLPPANQPSAFVDIPQPGDHLRFDPLIATFKVDEDFKNYFDIHSWTRKLARADDFKEYAQLAASPQYTGLGVKSEIVVAYLDSNRNPNLIVTYQDAFPVQLSGLTFNQQTPDVTTVSATAIFRYVNYDFEFVKSNTVFPENWLTSQN